MDGQGLVASGHDPLAQAMPLDEIRARLARIAAVTQAATGHMPAHADFIARHCSARR
jgi:tryptophan halogenase